MNTHIVLVSFQRQQTKREAFRAPPLGILQLAAHLQQNGFTASVLDVGEKDPTHQERICKAIVKQKATHLGISFASPLSPVAKRLIKKVRQFVPQITIIAGGPQPTLCPTLVLGYGADIIVKGEGEIPLLEVLSAYRRNRPPLAGIDNIGGLSFMKKGKVIDTGHAKTIYNLDALPFPDRSKIDIRTYTPLPNQYRNLPVLHLVTSRGCPFGCSFCSCEGIFGRNHRQRSVRNVIKEIRQGISEYRIREIYFYDDTLTANKKWIIGLCKTLIDEGLNIPWSCFSRIDTLDNEIIRMMKRAGCWNIFLGIEAGYQQGLDILGKKTTLRSIWNVVQMLNNIGIETRASFMLGIPGETPKEGDMTIRFACSLPIDYAQFNLFTPFPGIPLEKYAKETGEYSDNENMYDLWSPCYVPHGYGSKERLAGLQRNAFRRFYMRPTHGVRMASKVRSFNDIKRYLNGTLYLLRRY